MHAERPHVLAQGAKDCVLVSVCATAVGFCVQRLPVGQVVAGQTAALALKKVKRAQVTSSTAASCFRALPVHISSLMIWLLALPSACLPAETAGRNCTSRTAASWFLVCAETHASPCAHDSFSPFVSCTHLVLLLLLLPPGAQGHGACR
jgi:hypothetical protein